MNDDQLKPKLAISLFLLRLGISIVFLMWTIDKFINPQHTAAVFEHFYFISTLENNAAYAIGAVQLIVVLAFLFGALKTYSYLAILAMHTISTVSSYANYLDPWTSPNLLFFAAIPMLAGCWTLWSLRQNDTLFSIGARSSNT